MHRNHADQRKPLSFAKKKKKKKKKKKMAVSSPNKYTFTLCCKSMNYPEFLVRTLVPRRPKETSLCWKVFNGVLVLLSLGLTGFSAYELQTQSVAVRVVPPTASSTLFLCGQPLSGNARFCFEPAAGAPICPELLRVIDSEERVEHGSSAGLSTLAVINRGVSMASLVIVVLSYYTLLWRSKEGIKYATCGCSAALCKCCCSVEKCGHQCQSCSTTVDGLACGVDTVSIPLLIVAMVVSAIFLAIANTGYFYVQPVRVQPFRRRRQRARRAVDGAAHRRAARAHVLLRATRRRVQVVCELVLRRLL
jgi:hypothetical protein